jgi:hypothetical protein
MPKVHSHYDNLKVARNASPEKIRAAYRELTRKHHPDRNPDDAEAQRIMSVVNVAYAVLSDPAKRREHDLWLRQTEGAGAAPARNRHTLHRPTRSGARRPDSDDAQARRARRAALDRRVQRVKTDVRAHPVRYAAAALLILVLAIAGVRALLVPEIGMPIVTASTALGRGSTGYVRPAAAPNGQPWPARSGYVAGYPVANDEGLSEVMLDNSRNDADMFVKLVSLDGPSPVPVRTVFVAAHRRFRISDLNIGTYDLRYRDLTTGHLLRSPAFILEEVAMAGATQHSAPTLTLYQARDADLHSYALSDAEFF